MNLKRSVDYLVKAGAVVIILEPFWMLLPFAGFLYGSLLNLEYLKNSHYTIWLLYFVLPVQTLMPLAVALVVIGTSIFIIGALQIYLAKLRKGGMVKGGLYRKFRHPQYTGLTFLCMGFLLMWGRVIGYAVFFLMLFLYYHLARKEERICLKQFGRAYEDYMKVTYFLFPGDRLFSGLGSFWSSWIPNRPARALTSFLVLMVIGIGSCVAVVSMRINAISDLPISRTEISFTDPGGSEHRLNLALIEGFTGHLRKNGKERESELHNRVLLGLTGSESMKKALNGIELSRVSTLLCFLSPRTVQEKRPYYTEGKGDLFVILLHTPQQTENLHFADYRRGWDVLGALNVRALDTKEEAGEGDPVKGEIVCLKPFNGETSIAFQRRIEGVLNIYLSGLRREILQIDRLFEG